MFENSVNVDLERKLIPSHPDPAMQRVFWPGLTALHDGALVHESSWISGLAYGR